MKLTFTKGTGKFDRLDIVVSNAASGVLKPAMDMTLKHWRWCMETNAFALNLLAQRALPLMKDGGRIIAMSSLGSVRTMYRDRKSTRLNSSHLKLSRMPSSA